MAFHERVNGIRSSFRRPSTASAYPHFAFLDGVRGLAALYVLLHHASLHVTLSDLAAHDSGWSWFLAFRLWRLFSFGRDAVSVFIVLSGFCLMLPIARTEDGTLRGGVAGFLYGRLRRLVPPYYAAIGVSILLIVISAAIRTRSWPSWPVSAWEVVSHLLLVHNLSRGTIISINGSMWSIATEFQIYLLFPVLLIIWRGFGLGALVLSGLVMGYSVLVVGALAEHDVLFWLSPWYVGLFAFGMAGAVVCHSREVRFVHLRDRVRWDLLSYALWWAFLMIHLLGIRLDSRLDQHYWTDLILGLATASSIVHYATYRTSIRTVHKPLFLRILESRPVAGLGRFSYSLYLIHLPLVSFLVLLVPGADDISPPCRLVVSLGLSLLCIPAAYLFFLAFERPFSSAASVPRPALVTSEARPIGRVSMFQECRS
jgi:peptidoglycan/LPS O-acetylase OafA/YrhL